MKKGTEPAFPCTYQQTDKYGCQYTETLPGMSTRLLIASRAMCAILTNPDTGGADEKVIINTSLKFTDLLIKMEEETK